MLPMDWQILHMEASKLIWIEHGTSYMHLLRHGDVSQSARSCRREIAPRRLEAVLAAGEGVQIIDIINQYYFSFNQH